MIRRFTVLFLAALLPLLAGAGQAQAAGYRYWSFWDRDGSAWTYATVGPSLARPADGDVQGFRFSVSEDSGDAAKPRGTADFDTICAKTPAKDGTKRVALVIDFGTPADAPSGERPAVAARPARRWPGTPRRRRRWPRSRSRCATTATPCCARSCGYPAKGCGEQISVEGKGSASTGAADEASAQDDGGLGPSVGLIAGAAAVFVLGAAAVWQVRRRA